MVKVFFFHCPKAGGTSIRIALERATKLNNIAPLIENDSVDHASSRPYDRFRGYHLYSGHYGKDIYDAVFDRHIPITNFRHPVSRMVSLYNYFRDHVDLPPARLQEDRYFAVRFAKEHDFEAFVTSGDPKITIYSRNQHIRQLTLSPWELGHFSLDHAWNFVLSMPCYFVCEYPELSSAWLCDTLGLDVIGNDNQTVGASRYVQAPSLKREIIDKILLYNSGDLALYQRAVDLFLSPSRGKGTSIP
jgi:hypothetical protein